MKNRTIYLIPWKMWGMLILDTCRVFFKSGWNHQWEGQFKILSMYTQKIGFQNQRDISLICGHREYY